MANGFSKSRTYLLLCILIFVGCTQDPGLQDNTTTVQENTPASRIDQLYKMASDKNAACLQPIDSILTSTSDPNSRAEAFYIKGLYYANVRELTQAEQYLDSTIKENYTFYDAYIEKGILLNEKGEHEKALTSLQIALEMTKNNADLYYWMGKSYEGMKKVKEAQAFYNMTLKLDPSYQSAEEALKRTKQ